jgi:hypothetical protein
VEGRAPPWERTARVGPEASSQAVRTRIKKVPRPAGRRGWIPPFKEKSLGFTTFRAFVESRSDHVVSKVGANGQLTVRLA